MSLRVIIHHPGLPPCRRSYQRLFSERADAKRCKLLRADRYGYAWRPAFPAAADGRGGSRHGVWRVAFGASAFGAGLEDPNALGACAIAAWKTVCRTLVWQWYPLALAFNSVGEICQPRVPTSSTGRVERMGAFSRAVVLGCGRRTKPRPASRQDRAAMARRSPARRCVFPPGATEGRIQPPAPNLPHTPELTKTNRACFVMPCGAERDAGRMRKTAATLALLAPHRDQGRQADGRIAVGSYCVAECDRKPGLPNHAP
jgi:hypothetical protein